MRMAAARHCKRQCGFCGKEYQNSMGFAKHFKVSHDASYACYFCEQYFTTDVDRANHSRDVHTISAKIPCLFCSEMFTNGALFYNHLDSNHEDKRKDHYCKQCDQFFVEPGVVRLHRQYFHVVSTGKRLSKTTARVSVDPANTSNSSDIIVCVDLSSDEDNTGDDVIIEQRDDSKSNTPEYDAPPTLTPDHNADVGMMSETGKLESVSPAKRSSNFVDDNPLAHRSMMVVASESSPRIMPDELAQALRLTPPTREALNAVSAERKRSFPGGSTSTTSPSSHEPSSSKKSKPESVAQCNETFKTEDATINSLVNILTPPAEESSLPQIQSVHSAIPVPDASSLKTDNSSTGTNNCSDVVIPMRPVFESSGSSGIESAISNSGATGTAMVVSSGEIAFENKLMPEQAKPKVTPKGSGSKSKNGTTKKTGLGLIAFHWTCRLCLAGVKRNGGKDHMEKMHSDNPEYLIRGKKATEFLIRTRDILADGTVVKPVEQMLAEMTDNIPQMATFNNNESITVASDHITATVGGGGSNTELSQATTSGALTPSDGNRDDVIGKSAMISFNQMRNELLNGIKMQHETMMKMQKVQLDAQYDEISKRMDSFVKQFGLE